VKTNSKEENLLFYSAPLADQRAARERIKGALEHLFRFGLLPLLFYLMCFCVITYPSIKGFSTRVIGDPYDTLQNVWNLWWVHKSVIELHTSPWFTRYLHWPFGVSLLGHTLNPFNGFVTMFLLSSIGLTRAYNLMVIISYLLGGLGAFLLAYDLTRSYWPSLLGGYIFTFSSFHFAHTLGHLQLVSLEWIPVFLLLWSKLLCNPRANVAAGAAVALFLVILCDYYYFFYCVLTALIMFGWRATCDRNTFPLAKRELWIAFGIFSIITLGTSGVLAGALLLANRSDPLLGAHDPQVYSQDLLALFVYGAHWRFYSLTGAVWEQFRGNISENSGPLGFSVLYLLDCAWRRRKSIEAAGTRLWFLILAFFLVMALGPELHIGRRFFRPSMPYGWLEEVFPPLKMSGCPGRMMVMVYLSAGVISAAGLKLLLQGSRRNRRIAAALVGALLLEYLPRPLTMTPLRIPEYAKVLRSLPGNDGVLDLVSDRSSSLLYQTVHEKPLAFGYLARVPASVDGKDRKIALAIYEARFGSLWVDYHIRYFVRKDAPLALRDSPYPKVVWSDGRVQILDLAPEATR
jgi:hypothetical protein